MAAGNRAVAALLQRAPDAGSPDARVPLRPPPRRPIISEREILEILEQEVPPLPPESAYTSGWHFERRGNSQIFSDPEHMGGERIVIDRRLPNTSPPPKPGPEPEPAPKPKSKTKPKKDETWKFDPVDITVKIKPKSGEGKGDSSSAAPKAPPDLSVDTILFEKQNLLKSFAGAKPKFADPAAAAAEIKKVADILTADPELEVTIEASVGITPEFMAGKPGFPTGSGPAAQERWGDLMDARAKLVQDELVRHGISAKRIHLSRGSADVGAAGRLVKFKFGR